LEITWPEDVVVGVGGGGGTGILLSLLSALSLSS
jgi:hypothetical protein